MALSPSIRRKIFQIKYRERKQHLDTLEQLAMMCLLDAEDETDEDSAMLIAAMAIDEAAKLKQDMHSKKFGSRGSMSRESFWELHDLISGDQIFQSKGKKPQRSVELQLATFLCRVGAETSVKIASVMSIAEGTVDIYCKRVCHAIRQLRDDNMVFINKNVAIAALLAAPVIAAPLWQAPADLGLRRGTTTTSPLFHWHRAKDNHKKDADVPTNQYEARELDLGDFKYARRARALQRRNAYAYARGDMVDELD
ncbi:hypothetical protein DFP72DRAFT_1076206 [Ephemerocybe angulata]|uniref:Uncharacterized protein n=1 Tax=Ephemerocybe angulata TaxID=980116 RepID=A0A8H6HJ10_9AGAR|nr:hypothetical protein DFP72DRAFT_1076206 [Tulosesus angulatus]